jgi:hypothetical protein
MTITNIHVDSVFVTLKMYRNVHRDVLTLIYDTDIRGYKIYLM